MRAPGTEIDGGGCQSVSLAAMSERLSTFQITTQYGLRLRRALRRRVNYLYSRIARPSDKAATPAHLAATPAGQPLRAGQLVRVRSREEILATLDAWYFLKGCGFMGEMWQYCGTEQRVLKPVRRFLDERDYRVKKSRGIVLLEGLTCEGTRDYGPCDRNCYYFWREEWLIGNDPAPDLGAN